MWRLAPLDPLPGNVPHARPGADAEIDRLPEVIPLEAEDLPRGSPGLQVHNHNAESRNDFFPPDKEVQITRQLVTMAAVGVGQPLLRTEQTVPRVETPVEVNVFVAFRGAVSIFDTPAHQFFSHGMSWRCGPKRTVDRAAAESCDHVCQLTAGNVRSAESARANLGRPRTCL